MPQFPLCSEFIPLLDTVKNQLAELKVLSQEFLILGDDETKQKALLKGQELEKTKQQMVELKEEPVEFEDSKIPRIEKEVLTLFRNKLGSDLKYEVNNGAVSKINVSGSGKSAAVLEVCLKYLRLFGGLQELSCSNTQLTVLPETLPAGLQGLYCSSTQLTALSEILPAGLQRLNCSNTQLIALPETLPAGLLRLYCFNTQLTVLPETLPAGLQRIECTNTQLTALPETLPASLQELYCDNTPAAKNPETKKQLEEFKKSHPGFEYRI